MELNERIIQARKQAGLTQEQLGEKLGVSRQAVSKWESGQANPDVTYIMEMCSLFDVSADWLLLGREATNAEAVRCAECGAAIHVDAAFCHKCGTRLDGRGGYCLYLTGHGEFSWGLAELVANLFAQDWAKPAFPWDDSKIDTEAAWNIIRNAPMVLCKGLTKDQATLGKSLFRDYGRMVLVHREEDVVEYSPGVFKPKSAPVTVAVDDNAREPLSGWSIFGLVVLGVVVAILLMSIF